MQSGPGELAWTHKELKKLVKGILVTQYSIDPKAEAFESVILGSLIYGNTDEINA